MKKHACVRLYVPVRKVSRHWVGCSWPKRKISKLIDLLRRNKRCDRPIVQNWMISSSGNSGFALCTLRTIGAPVSQMITLISVFESISVSVIPTVDDPTS